MSVAAPALIQVGQPIPDVQTPSFLGTVSCRYELSPSKGKYSLLVTLPSKGGVFTETCTKKHLAGFLALDLSFFSMGVEKIVFVSKNTLQQMYKWANIKDKSPVRMHSDPEGQLLSQLVPSVNLANDKVATRAVLVFKGTDQGAILHAKFVEEDPQACTVSSPEAVYLYMQRLSNESQAATAATINGLNSKKPSPPQTNSQDVTAKK